MIVLIIQKRIILLLKPDNQASRLPQERESLDDRIAIEFRRRYGDIQK
jgi:hypothetical protein